MFKYSLNEFMKKEFYVIDCKNFVFFPRIIHIIGFEKYVNSPVLFYTNIKGSRGLYIEELERFKTFEEAEREATRLNSISDIEKRTEEWYIAKNMYEKALFKNYLKEKSF